MIVLRGNFIGPLNALRLGLQKIKLFHSSRLLRITIDDKPTWSLHIYEIKEKGFAIKPILVK